ncbi:MAG TPA: DUF971 domain-containing protein [Candidatus Acidoferrales bacterium]|nr:DUF971 domain-containing protein [Candidatus Acidoferrales bacterium]
MDRQAQVMEIAWEDGHRSPYPARLLRWACPCAACRGEAGEPGRLDLEPSLGDDELKVTDVSLIGQYALQIAFASGHATGIYTFRYLRGLCPCPECDARRRMA